MEGQGEAKGEEMGRDRSRSSVGCRAGVEVVGKVDSFGASDSRSLSFDSFPHSDL